MTAKKITRMLVALVAVLGLVASACGDDEEAAPAQAESPAPSDEAPDAGDEARQPESNVADDSLEPVTIGFDSQEEELFSIIEARRAAEATVAYINAELGGVGGHPLQLDVCTSGDGPEGAVACAQQFVNNEDITVMLTSSFSSNEASEVTVPAGLPLIALANLPDDWQRATEWVFDPGFLGLVQAPVDYASQTLGASSIAVICLDDPFYLEACDAAVDFAEAAGMTASGPTPAGFEQADFTGVVTASGAADADAVFVVVDGSQCAPLADSLAALAADATILTVDTCALEDALAGGVLDDWLVFGASALPVDPSEASPEILEAQRIVSEYGSAEAELFGLAGWAIANVLATHNALERVGPANLSRQAVNDALGETQLDLGWYADISCPGPEAFPGACVSSVIVLKVVGESMVLEGIAPIDFTQFEGIG